jgi:2-methylaconitate cis-trans-isomerase PrpF
MGLAKAKEEVSRTVPKIGIVSMSTTHPVLSGDIVKTTPVDLVVRFISDTQPHRAIPLTAALTTAVAAKIPGSVVNELLAPAPVAENILTIGHTSGRILVGATTVSYPPFEVTPLLRR